MDKFNLDTTTIVQQKIEAGLGFSPSMICRCLPRIRYMHVVPTASSQESRADAGDGGNTVQQAIRQYRLAAPVPLATHLRPALVRKNVGPS